MDNPLPERPLALGNNGSRVEACCRGVVRLIRANGLQEGARLPPQSELRRILEVSNNSLTPAMAALTRCGVLHRAVGVGTEIADLSALERVRWTVGIASLAVAQTGASPFFSYLYHHVVTELTRAGCRCLTYVRSDEPHWPHRISDFADLDTDIRGGVIDGLVLLANLHPDGWHEIAQRGMAICHVGPEAGGPCGVGIDMVGFAVEALQALREEGCAHVLVPHRLFHVAGAEERLAGRRFPELRLERLDFGHSPVDGERLAARLVRRTPANRPDGILVLDDHPALGLSAAFAVGGNYRPRIAAMTNSRLTPAFALPVLRWDIDVEALVQRAARLLMARLHGRLPAGRTELVAPKRVEQGTQRKKSGGTR